MNLKDILEAVSRSRGAAYLKNDPVQFPRRFDIAADREVVAFISASLAYGRVGIILKNVNDLLARMGNHPGEFVRNFDPRQDSKYLTGFKHRFNDGNDLACLFWILRHMLESDGSIEAYFARGDNGGPTIDGALTSFCSRAKAVDVSPFFPVGTLPVAAGVRYFFPSPATGSACKRLCMFLRWVTRPDDGIDLGLWSSVAPSRLVLPLDTHTARISRLIGLSVRRTPDWKMAVEITERLRILDAADPVRFDFALAHLGISGGCTGKRGSACDRCDLEPLCGLRASGCEKG